MSLPPWCLSLREIVIHEMDKRCISISDSKSKFCKARGEVAKYVLELITHCDSSLKKKYLPASWGAGIPHIKTDMVWTLQSSFNRSALHPVKSLNLLVLYGHI